MRIASLIGLAALAATVSACEEKGGQVLGIDATGDLRGEAFLDRDGDGRRTGVDPAFPRLRIAILPQGGGSPVAQVTTDSLGQFHARRLPVGSYTLSPDPASVGDSVHVERIDSAQVTLAANDTVSSIVTIGYNTPTAAQISTLPGGTRVAIFATALNGWATFGDSTVHLSDSTGAVRAVAILPTQISAGDRLRATATVGTHLGRVALTSVTVVSRTPGDLPVAIDTSTNAAARAGGKLNSAQVRVDRAAVLTASSLTGGDVLFTVDDGSGPLDVLVDATAGIATTFPIALGAELDVTGVLVPLNDGSNRWRLKPRFTGDIVVRYLPITIASARTRQPNQLVMVHGIALNDRASLGDGTVHVTDATGSIRVLESIGFFAPGDSISVFGRIDIATGNQTVIRQAEIAVLARRSVPAPTGLTTASAATAATGTRDAALVRVTNAVFDTVRVGGELQQRLNDGSGVVQLVPPPVFQMPAQNARVDLTGLLVPVGAGRWVIRPRTAGDVVIR